jgi:hypothetical protein
LAATLVMVGDGTDRKETCTVCDFVRQPFVTSVTQ